jgi:hypothetical protein
VKQEKHQDTTGGHLFTCYCKNRVMIICQDHVSTMHTDNGRNVEPIFMYAPLLRITGSQCSIHFQSMEFHGNIRQINVV